MQESKIPSNLGDKSLVRGVLFLVFLVLVRRARVIDIRDPDSLHHAQ